MVLRKRWTARRLLRRRYSSPSAPAPEILVQTQFVGSEKKKGVSRWSGLPNEYKAVGSQIFFGAGLASLVDFWLWTSQSQHSLVTLQSTTQPLRQLGERGGNQKYGAGGEML